MKTRKTTAWPAGSWTGCSRASRTLRCLRRTRSTSSRRLPERAIWQRIAAYGPLRAFSLAGREIEGSRRALSYRAEVGDHLLL